MHIPPSPLSADCKIPIPHLIIIIVSLPLNHPCISVYPLLNSLLHSPCLPPVHPINTSSSSTISPASNPSTCLPQSISSFLPPSMPLVLPHSPIHYFIPPSLFPSLYSAHPSINVILLPSFILPIYPFPVVTLSSTYMTVRPLQP